MYIFTYLWKQTQEQVLMHPIIFFKIPFLSFLSFQLDIEKYFGWWQPSPEIYQFRKFYPAFKLISPAMDETEYLGEFAIVVLCLASILLFFI